MDPLPLSRPATASRLPAQPPALFEAPVISKDRRVAIDLLQQIEDTVIDNNKTNADCYALLNNLSQVKTTSKKQSILSWDVINIVQGVSKKCEINESLLNYLNGAHNHLLHSCREHVSMIFYTIKFVLYLINYFRLLYYRVFAINYDQI